MSIVLLVLKIIGCVLGILVLTALILLCVVLFYPIPYSLFVDNTDTWKMKGIFSFFGILFRIKIWYEEELKYKIVVLGIPIKTNVEKRPKFCEKKENKNKQTSDAVNEEEIKEQQSPNKENKKPAYVTEKKSKSKKNTKDRLGFLRKIRTSFSDFSERILHIRKVLKKIHFLITDEKMQRCFVFCKDQIIWFLKKIKPTKIKGKVTFGMEDPSVTGCILGGVAILNTLWDLKQVRITPDFQKKLFDITLLISGRVKGIWILKLVLIYMRDPHIKYMKRQIEQ